MENRRNIKLLMMRGKEKRVSNGIHNHSLRHAKNAIQTYRHLVVSNMYSYAKNEQSKHVHAYDSPIGLPRKDTSVNRVLTEKRSQHFKSGVEIVPELLYVMKPEYTKILPTKKMKTNQYFPEIR